MVTDFALPSVGGVQMKAVGAVRKQQHIVDRVLAMSTMRFRYTLQTDAVTVDGARLDDDEPRGL